MNEPNLEISNAQDNTHSYAKQKIIVPLKRTSQG